MHILIAIITAVAGLIWALHSLQNAGVDLNSFNPFTWMRRRKWEKQLGVKPIHRLENSMEAAALLVVATAKADGEITRETKQEILSLFKTEFGISQHNAESLFFSSSHLLQDVVNMADEVRHVLAPTQEQFQPRQIRMLISMMQQTARAEAAVTPQQQAIIEAVKKVFGHDEEVAQNW